MKTHILFVLDKSGSMRSRQQATISGFNEYLYTLKQDANLTKSTFTLVTFDTAFTAVNVNEQLADVAELNSQTYVPSGLTALYDAIAHVLSITKDNVKKKHRALVVILTDGEENSSREYTRQQIFDMIQQYEKQGNYTFVYLGCDQDVWEEGNKIGMSVGNTKEFEGDDIVADAYGALTVATSNYAGGQAMRSTAFWDSDTP